MVTGVRFYGPDGRSRRRKRRDLRLLTRARFLQRELERNPVWAARTIRDAYWVVLVVGVLGGLVVGVVGTLLVVGLAR